MRVERPSPSRRSRMLPRTAGSSSMARVRRSISSGANRPRAYVKPFSLNSAVWAALSMLGMVSSNLDRMEDVSPVFLGHRHLTPKLLLRQHVGQQGRIVAGHGDETIAGAVQSAEDIGLLRRILAVGHAVGLDRSPSAGLGIHALPRPSVQLRLELLGILAPPRALGRLGRIE